MVCITVQAREKQFLSFVCKVRQGTIPVKCFKACSKPCRVSSFLCAPTLPKTANSDKLTPYLKKKRTAIEAFKFVLPCGKQCRRSVVAVRSKQAIWLIMSRLHSLMFWTGNALQWNSGWGKARRNSSACKRASPAFIANFPHCVQHFGAYASLKQFTQWARLAHRDNLQNLAKRKRQWVLALWKTISVPPVCRWTHLGIPSAVLLHAAWEIGLGESLSTARHWHLERI